MNKGKIEIILKELASKTTGIQGAVLVSSQGQLLTTPIGIDHNSTLIIAGTMLHLAGCIREEFNWQEIEQISVRAQEGYIILTICNQDVFLLVKTDNVPLGFLEGDINHNVRKLRAELQVSEAIQLNPLWDDSQITIADKANINTAQPANATQDLSASSETTNIELTPIQSLPALSADEQSPVETVSIPSPEPETVSSLNPEFLKLCQQELARCIGPFARFLIEDTLAEHPQIAPQQLVEVLAAEIPNPEQAKQFNRNVGRSPHLKIR